MAIGTYPNRLEHFMRAAKLNDPQLARVAGTTRQQIFKLRRGERQLTPNWAKRLAPHVNATWQELCEDPETDSGGAAGARAADDVALTAAAPAAPQQIDHWTGWGARIQTVRQASAETELGFARMVGISVAELRALEAEKCPLTFSTLALLHDRADIPSDFVLFGDTRPLTGFMLQRIVNLGVRPDSPIPARDLRAAARASSERKTRGSTLHERQAHAPSTIRPPDD